MTSNLYANYGYGKYQTGLRNEVQQMRRKLREMEWQKEREQLLVEEEERKARELEKFRQLEAEKREIERKTKRYYEFDAYDRKKLVRDRTYYFGDHDFNNGAWRPDGKGEVFDQYDKVLDGKFRQGDYQGGMTYFKSTEQTWKGPVKGDLIQGDGTITTKSYREKTAKDLHFAEDHLEPGSFVSSSNNSVNSGETREFSLKRMKKAVVVHENDEEAPDSARRERQARDEKRKHMVEMTKVDDALAFNGEIMCTRNELIPGVRIEFFDDQYARVAVSDSTQLATTNLSPPRHTRNSAVHKIEAIRGYHERIQGINDGLPKLQIHHIPGPQSIMNRDASNNPHQFTSQSLTSITEDSYERNAGPRKLNSLDRGHFSIQATIIEHRRDWKYLVRLDDEVYPRDRILDLEHLGRFRLMREQPRVYHLHSFPAVFTNHPHNNTPYQNQPVGPSAHHSVVSSNLFDDDLSSLSFGQGHGHEQDSLYFHSEASVEYSSTLSYNAPVQRVIAHPDHPRHTMDYREHLPQHTVTSRLLLPNLPSRSAHARRENYFETAMMGYGTTQAEAELKEKQRIQRLQWKRFIEDKKKAFEAERQRQIEEEQGKQLQSSVAKAVEDKLAQQQRDADDDEMTRQSGLSSVYSEFGNDP